MFWKKGSVEKGPEWPGTQRAASGIAAVLEVLASATGSVTVERRLLRDPVLSGLLEARPNPSLLPELVKTEDAIGWQLGMTLTGRRTTAICSAQSLQRSSRQIERAVETLQPMNILAVLGPDSTHTFLDHIAAAGAVVLLAADVQEIVDLTLIGRAVSESALVPCIVAAESESTWCALQHFRAPEPDLFQRIAGLAAEPVESQTEAQRLLFGANRERIPALLDPKRPLGTGISLHPSTRRDALAAHQLYLAREPETAFRDTCSLFENLTHRAYGFVASKTRADAESLIICRGALRREYQSALEPLRTGKDGRAAVLGIRAAGKIYTADLAASIERASAITVLDTAESGLSWLYQQVQAAVAAGGQTSDPPVRYGRYVASPGAWSRADIAATINAGSSLPSRFVLGFTAGEKSATAPRSQLYSHKLRDVYPPPETLAAAASENEPNTGTRNGMLVTCHSEIHGHAAVAMQCVAAALSSVTHTEVSSRTLAATAGAALAAHQLMARSDAVQAVSIAGFDAGEAITADWLDSNGAHPDILVLDTGTDGIWPKDDFAAAHLRRAAAGGARVFALPAQLIASELAPGSPQWQPFLRFCATVGACFGCASLLSRDQLAAVSDQLRSQTALPSPAWAISALERGYAEVAACSDSAGGARKARSFVEPDAPESFLRGGPGDASIFDPGRFWQDVQVPFRTGRERSRFLTPFDSLPVIPAKSGIPIAPSRFSQSLPHVAAENCTGCARCIALCPQSALIGTEAHLDDRIAFYVENADPPGGAMQIGRYRKHLVSQVHRTLVREQVEPPYTCGGLLKTAIRFLETDGALTAELAGILTRELAAIIPEHEPEVIVTDRGFRDVEKQHAGTGRLLTIVANPELCTGCRLCEHACPESAIDSVTIDKDAALHRHRAELCEKMALTRLSTRQAAGPESVTNFFDFDTNRTLPGDGRNIRPASRIALRLFLSAAHVSAHERQTTLKQELQSRIEALESRLKSAVEGLFELNDFESLRARLANLESSAVAATDVADVLGRHKGTSPPDRKRTLRIVDSLCRLREIYNELFTDGLACPAVLLAADDLLHTLGTAYPVHPLSMPLVQEDVTAGSSLIRGVQEGLVQQAIRLAGPLRESKALLDSRTDPGELEMPAGFADLDTLEKMLLPPVVVVWLRDENRPGIRFPDIALDSMPVTFLVIDRLGPSHGVEALPGLRFHTFFGKDAASNTLAVRTSIGAPEHAFASSRAALERTHSLVHIHAPDSNDPAGSAVAAFEHARRAIESRAWPMMRIDHKGVDISANPDPDATWPVKQRTVRNAAGDRETISERLTPAHWAVHDPAFHEATTAELSERNRAEAQHLADYLDCEPESRAGKAPYIYSDDEQGEAIKIWLPPAIVAFAENCVSFWRAQVQSAAAEETVPEEPKPPAAAAGIEPAPEETRRQLTELLLEWSGFGNSSRSFAQAEREGNRSVE